jgi:surface antigen
MSRARLAAGVAALGLTVLAAGLTPAAARATVASPAGSAAGLAPARLAPVRLAPVRLAPVRLVPVSLAPVKLARVKLVLGRWAGRAGTRAAAAFYGYPYPHPPACTDGGACVADKWAFYRGQCTSWAAYRLNERGRVGFTNGYGGRGRWGNALHWGPQARKLGIAVNRTPAVGAVAWYSATRPAPDGHVAYVEKVLSRTSIVMSEMNYDADNGFWVHVITRATGDWPTDFIHFKGRA